MHILSSKKARSESGSLAFKSNKAMLRTATVVERFQLRINLVFRPGHYYHYPGHYYHYLFVDVFSTGLSKEQRPTDMSLTVKKTM